MAKRQSLYGGGHGMMLGLLALAGVVWWLRRPDGAAQPVSQLPG